MLINQQKDTDARSVKTQMKNRLAMLGALSALTVSDNVAVIEPTSSLQCGAWDDDVGSLELADYVGAMRRRSAPRRASGRNVPRRTQLVPSIPGVPAPTMRLQPLGLGATAFTATSGTLLQLQASPQRPFMGQRLILDLTRTGASATGLVTVSRLDVGTDNQLVGAGAISASAFSATAFDANVRFAPATPGVLITVQMNITAAPTMTDRVDVGGTIFGTTVG